jgi:hypothetical protein
MDILGMKICPYRNLKHNLKFHSTDINLTIKKYGINKNKMEKHANKTKTNSAKNNFSQQTITEKLPFNISSGTSRFEN